MNVHEAISAHSKKQHLHLVEFEQLDAQREAAIEAAVEACSNGRPFDTNAINEATARINAHAKKGISPTRSFVTSEMVRQFVARSGDAQ